MNNLYLNKYKGYVFDKFENYHRNYILKKLFVLNFDSTKPSIKPESILDVAGGCGIIAEWLLKEIKCDVTLILNNASFHGFLT